MGILYIIILLDKRLDHLHKIHNGEYEELMNQGWAAEIDEKLVSLRRKLWV